MLLQFCEIELKKLRDGLRIVSDRDYPLHVLLREQLALISKSLVVLDAFIKEHSFTDEQSEINYYKDILPQFKSLQIYYSERYALLNRKPLTGNDSLEKYYQDNLQYIERYLLRHQFQYEYFHLNMTELDTVIFIQWNNIENGLPPILEGFEAKDTPPMSYLFSKFIAYEKLREDILSLIDEIHCPIPILTTGMNDKGKLHKPIKWTGEKINLIEMVHGLYTRKQVNDGKIGIGEFFEAVGDFFGVDLGIPKRGFDDLKVRKKLSKTHFIDGMRDELLKKMEDEDAYDPEKFDRKKMRF